MEEFIMSKQFDKKFKEDAAKYYFEHRELGLKGCAEKLGISRTALGVWTKEAKGNNGEVPTRGSGNYESDEAKENARLRRELRDTQDALAILKKAIGILGN
jgi:transposase